MRSARAHRPGFTREGKRVACVPVPLRARPFDSRTKLGIAVGVAIGAVERPAAPNDPRPVSRIIKLTK